MTCFEILYDTGVGHVILITPCPRGQFTRVNLHLEKRIVPPWARSDIVYRALWADGHVRRNHGGPCRFLFCPWNPDAGTVCDDPGLVQGRQEILEKSLRVCLRQRFSGHAYPLQKDVVECHVREIVYGFVLQVLVKTPRGSANTKVTLMMLPSHRGFVQVERYSMLDASVPEGLATRMILVLGVCCSRCGG